MNAPRIVIAGTHSGVGKTTVATGLMAALRQRDLVVQGFKAGPDYIDPGFHTAVTGRSSRNLDSWMTDRHTVKELFLRGSQGADISVIEGVMGLYDGKDPSDWSGSTADLAMLLQAPVVLVVDVSGMAASAAAVVRGFQMLEPKLLLVGVIVNSVGSEGHYQLVRQAIETHCGIPVIGYLQRQFKLSLPERHLGLVPVAEQYERMAPFLEAASRLGETVDLERLLTLAVDAPRLEATVKLFAAPTTEPDVAIAVARDQAFHFYYPENLELLEHYGARLVFYRPSEGETIPREADGLYLGGGFPEQFAARLSGHQAMLDDLRRRIHGSLPTVAECGGFMLLAKSITDKEGQTFPMAGVVPVTVKMQMQLAALGYREVKALLDGPAMEAGDTARGHEFHYSVAEWQEGSPRAYQFSQRGESREEGIGLSHLAAGYIHLHFASNPKVAERFVASCRAYGYARRTEIGSDHGTGRRMEV